MNKNVLCYFFILPSGPEITCFNIKMCVCMGEFVIVLKVINIQLREWKINVALWLIFVVNDK